MDPYGTEDAFGAWLLLSLGVVAGFASEHSKDALQALWSMVGLRA